MDLLSLFGLVSLALTLVCYTYESRNHWFILGFSFTCVLASIYGFLQGAWPFGIIEIIWAIVVFKKWMKTPDQA